MADERGERPSAIHGFPSRTSHTLSALSGGAFVVLAVIAFLLGRGHPTFNEPASRFVSYFSDHKSQLQISMLLSIFATFWLVWYFGFLRWLYEGAEKSARGFVRASPIAFAGGIAGAALASAAGIAEITAVEVNGSVLPGITRMLDLMHSYGLVWAEVLLSVHLLSAFFVIRVTEVLPEWLSLLAGVTAAIGFFQAVVVLAPAQDNGVFGIAAIVWFALFLVYILYTSINLARRVETALLAG